MGKSRYQKWMDKRRKKKAEERKKQIEELKQEIEELTPLAEQEKELIKLKEKAKELRGSNPVVDAFGKILKNVAKDIKENAEKPAGKKLAAKKR